MTDITYKQIGIIRTPFKGPKGVPIQPSAAEGVDGTVEAFPEYGDGLEDLGGFSHIFLLYHFHMVGESRLKVRPFMDERMHGVFSTRAPSRPNPIGISVVRLMGINGNILHIRDVDIVDGTPLLDIKPYVPEFDIKAVERKGWLEENVSKLPDAADDGRFL